jgi:branched-chain amino acid transport system substrate-binding protein
MGLRKRRLVPLVAASVALAVGISACGSDDDASSDGKKEYALAWAGPLTGDSANLGTNSLNGVKLAVEEFNKTGDIKIVLKPYDTQGDPAQATTVKDQYINDDSVIGLVGPTFSGETKAIIPDLQQNSLVMVSPSATNVALPTVTPGQTVFHRVMADDDAQGNGSAQYIIKKLAAKKVAFIHDNSDYGRPLAEGIEKQTTAAGINAVVKDAIDPKAQDYSSAVNKVKAAAPDVVFFGGYYPQAGLLRKQLVDAGVKSTFLSGDGSLDPGFVTAGGKNTDGAQITCPCNLATATSPGALGEFSAKYKALNNVEPGTYSVEGYDAANILIGGIKAGNTSRESLLEYVEQPRTYDGLSKKIEFADNGNVKATGIFFFEVKNGVLSLMGSSEELLK